MTHYSITTTVTSIREQKHQRYTKGSGTGNAAAFTNISLGWYVIFQGSWESLYFGETKPEFEEGDKVKISFEKII